MPSAYCLAYEPYDSTNTAACPQEQGNHVRHGGVDNYAYCQRADMGFKHARATPSLYSISLGIRTHIGAALYDTQILGLAFFPCSPHHVRLAGWTLSASLVCVKCCQGSFHLCQIHVAGLPWRSPQSIRVIPECFSRASPIFSRAADPAPAHNSGSGINITIGTHLLVSRRPNMLRKALFRARALLMGPRATYQ
jgi:hypothetical protein